MHVRAQEKWEKWAVGIRRTVNLIHASLQNMNFFHLSPESQTPPLSSTWLKKKKDKENI